MQNSSCFITIIEVDFNDFQMSTRLEKIPQERKTHWLLAVSLPLWDFICVKLFVILACGYPILDRCFESLLRLFFHYCRLH